MVLIRLVMDRLPGDWDVDSVGDDIFAAVLTPWHGDRFGSAFHVERTAEGVVVVGHRWDIIGAVGIFASILEALNAVAVIVKAGPSAATLRVQ